MKTIKKFNDFLNEDYTEAGENAGLYDHLSKLLDKASEITGEEYELPEEAIIGLQFAIDSGILDDTEDAEAIIDDIEGTLDELDNVEAQSYFDDEELDDLLDEATELTGVECHNMSCAYKELRKLGTEEAMNLYYRFVQYQDDRNSLED